jgi:hypothetical protein
MNDLQRSVKLQNLSNKSASSSAQKRRELTTYLLAALIVSAMIAWFGFLGWGFIAVLQWLADCISDVWAAHVWNFISQGK